MPSGFMSQRSRPPARMEKNAIVRPSGDHAGDQSATPGLFVRLLGVPPPEATTMISLSSPRGGFARYAISLPFGDQAGPKSSRPAVPAIRRGVPPGTATTQTSRPRRSAPSDA
jgi:hypothetical protein